MPHLLQNEQVDGPEPPSLIMQNRLSGQQHTFPTYWTVHLTETLSRVVIQRLLFGFQPAMTHFYVLRFSSLARQKSLDGY